MFIDFFYMLKDNGVSVSLREFLDLHEALDKEVAGPSIDDFYYLAKSILVKHETQLDRFDVIFAHYFNKLQGLDAPDLPDDFPEEWLRKHFELDLSPEDRERIEAMGGFEALLERFRQVWEQQRDRHEGGDQMIGTGGTSPFGNAGYNPEGFRIGEGGGQGRASKVWENRRYANLDDRVELNTRNMKLALRQLRMLTREGVPDELDLKKTIRKTSENAGMLDLHLVPTRKNRVKVLLMLDIGGSMDDHIRVCSELFSAARYEFKHLEHYYFHNCLYEYVWKDNRRRHSQRIPTWQLLHTYNKDYKVIWVGDAAMSPIELTHAGGSVEHWNQEPGLVWMQRMKEQFPSMAWLNPNPEDYWQFYESTNILRDFMENRMYPLSLEGLGKAMKELKGKGKK